MMPLTDTPMPCLDEPAFEAAIDLTRGPRYRYAVAKAKSVWGECPLIDACEAAAGDAPGVWGGKTLAERLGRSHLCGRRSGYNAHRRRHEAPCDECRIANAAYERQQYHDRKAKAA